MPFEPPVRSGHGLELALASLLLALNAVALGAEPAGSDAVALGARLFGERCVACHGLGVIVPPVTGIAKLSSERIYATITSGMMRDTAAGLSDDARRAIADYVAALAPEAPQAAAARSCPADKEPMDTRANPWPGWSPDVENTRFVASRDSALSPDNVRRARLKWAFVFPDTWTTQTSINQPTVSSGMVFISNVAGIVYALDAGSGCTYWSFRADMGVRSAIASDGGTVVFGDYGANVYALDAGTGRLRWKLGVDDQATARVSGNVTIHDGMVFVPVSGMQETYGIHPQLTCCLFRGSVLALDLQTGREIWKTYLIDEVPQELGPADRRVKRYGPSGVPIWSVPTVDAERGLLYVSTGNQYTEPVVPESDAIVALEIDTGRKRWIRTLAPEFIGFDVYHIGCEAWVDEKRSTCAPMNTEGRGDREFGAPAVLRRMSDGREILLAGSKDGVLYALDPDRDGRILWKQRLGHGGEFGGIEYGFAASEERAFVAISDLNADLSAEGSLNAVDLGTGWIVWRVPGSLSTCDGRPAQCSNAGMAAVTAAGSVVFAGSMDGHLRAYSTDAGELLWDYDTSAEVLGVNGLSGHGGSIASGGTAVYGRMFYQTSGIGWMGVGMPGNVLLAFEVPAD